MCFTAVFLLTANLPAAKVSENVVNVFYQDSYFKRTFNYCVSIAKRKQYFDFIKPIFYKHDLPKSLVYLPVIESCFDPYAESPKGALGMWQINGITAKHVGLKEGFFTDERYNWKKSTVAAAKYLVFLSERFDNLDLIVAAYNVGPTFLKKQMDKYKTSKIEKLRLPKETTNYVYKFRAMMKIMNTKRS